METEVVKASRNGIVYVISTHTFVSLQLAGLLAQEPSIEVRLAREVECWQELSDGAVVVIDQAGLKNPLDVVLRETASRFPGARLMVIAENQADLRDLIAMQRLGVYGWIKQGDVLACLIPAVLAVRQGLRCARTQDMPMSIEATERLSEGREQEVFEMLRRGCPNREIALGIGIGESTVKTHVSRILKKLGISSRRELAWDRVPGLRATPIKPTPAIRR